jgi:hypothetical protein
MTDNAQHFPFDVSRRGFLRLGAMTAVGVNFSGMDELKSHHPSMIDVPFSRVNPKIGMIGTGKRGTRLLGDLLANEGQVVALCDTVKEHATAAQALVETAGQKAPELYTNGDHAFEALTAREDLDLIIIATPWDWHVEMAVSGMKRGKHVAVEVPAATTIDECWKLVDTSEETRRHCIILENCCYGYNETLVLRMVHAGLLGELLYGEGAYLHDLREILFANESEGLWRRAAHTQREGNLYPTHGLGPVANYMGIERGDRFDYLVSMSSPQRGLDVYRKEHISSSDPKWKERYVNGDMNTSMIKTSRGLNIILKHDVVNPRPYDRVNTIAGTKGIFTDYPPRIYIEGQKGDEAWSTIDAFKQYEHPLWKKEGENAKRLGGHGGMDYIMLYRLLQCMREGLVPDMDVYDAASWSAPGPLSLKSVEEGSAPVRFPDFTRGQWQKRSISAIATQL